MYIVVSRCTKCGHMSRFLSSERWICCVKCRIRGMETRWLDLTLMDLPWTCKRLAVRRACVYVWRCEKVRSYERPFHVCVLMRAEQ